MFMLIYLHVQTFYLWQKIIFADNIGLPMAQRCFKYLLSGLRINFLLLKLKNNQISTPALEFQDFPKDLILATRTCSVGLGAAFHAEIQLYSTT